uniref:Hyp1 n=1 Tax=Moniliophthora roreri (strain MCA 2997) TaxID=1381753 RepID=F2WVH5_MONRO|nr:hyp1 [Moniliophthora roreri]ADO51584.1 hyp1 [Moniliophthora roreri]
MSVQRLIIIIFIITTYPVSSSLSSSTNQWKWVLFSYYCTPPSLAFFLAGWGCFLIKRLQRLRFNYTHYRKLSPAQLAPPSASSKKKKQQKKRNLFNQLPGILGASLGKIIIFIFYLLFFFD